MPTQNNNPWAAGGSLHEDWSKENNPALESPFSPNEYQNEGEEYGAEYQNIGTEYANEFSPTDTDVLDSRALFENDREVLGLEGKEKQEIDFNNLIAVINNRKITGKEILIRQKVLKDSILKVKYNSLTIQEKLIIDMPILMLKLGWVYSAYCQLHWLEATGSDIQIPFDFVNSYERSKSSIKRMYEKLKLVQYASYDDFANHRGKIFTNRDEPFLLYNLTLNNCQVSYYKAINYINSIKDVQFNFGNFNMNEAPPKMNFIDAISAGSALGDLDDLGASLGRYSLRIYVKGEVENQGLNDPTYNELHLKIIDVGFRFGDEFSFNGDQTLGYWSYNLNNVEIPNRTTFFNDGIKLSNSDYRNLKSKKLDIGNDYNIFTDIRYNSLKNGLKVNSPIIFFTPK